MAAGLKALVGLAFLGSIGLLFLFLACALPSYNNWWPMFTIIFYVLSPLPSLITRRFTDDLSSTSALKEFCYFLTTGIVLSAFALPIVLARAPSGATGEETVIATGACFLVLMGNLVMFLTIYGLFMIFDNEDGFEYSNWGSGF
ncbi:leptin receptor gene-related protein-like [Tigriopus californicus]|uniref:leptin receptor gene-related protein-like n=1 Tax=Tigriopus californicus TaxID=6832 RepID=UPI0027DA034D|nr:leptin receptor gene-related protein-like [Tigriopus californicus]